MAGIKIPVEAAFSKESSEQVVKDFTKQFNQLGDAIAKVAKMKFDPLDKGTLDHVRQVNANFQQMLKVHGDLRSRMKSTGQSGAGLFDLNWEAMYPDHHSRARQMAKVFNYVTGGAHLSALPPAAPAAPAARPADGSPRAAPAAAPPPPSNTARVLRAGLNASGFGGVGNAAISDGMQFGVGAGLAGLAGGLLALGVGKLVSGVREKVGAAQNESIGYDTLKRQLGDVNVGFDRLKDSLRSSANGLGLTFDEAQRLGTLFGRTSGMVGAGGLAEEVRNGAGFSRAFGLDPSQGTSFFASMRLNGVTRNVDDSRRLGLLIGEGIAKSGAFAKTEEVLQAVAGFVESTARGSLTVANVGAYAGFLTSMMGSGVPGTDPASSASLVARANAAFVGGGSEAHQNFYYRALGGRLGLNPVQATVMREGGLFGTGASAFGPGSVYAQFAGAFGGKVPSGAAGSRTPAIDMVMQSLTGMYGNRPDLMANALSGMTGLNTTQAMMFALTAKRYGGSTLGGLQKRLGRLGFRMEDIDPTAIANMGAFEADGSLSEGQKDAKISAAARDGQIMTEGKLTRDTITGVSNTMQAAADKLLGPLNDIRAAVMYLAGNGKKSPREIQQELATIEINDKYAKPIADATLAHGQANARLGRARATNAPRDTIQTLQDLEASTYQRLQALKGERSAALDALGLSSRAPGASPVANVDTYDGLFDRIGRDEGVDPRLLKAIAGKESGFDPNAVGFNKNGSVDLGLMQHNSRFLKERGMTAADAMNPEIAIRKAAQLLKSNGVRSDARTAIARYNGSGPGADAYAADVLSRYGSTTLSAAALERERTASGGKPSDPVSIHLEGRWVLLDGAGRPLATHTATDVTVGRPTPAGAR